MLFILLFSCLLACGFTNNIRIHIGDVLKLKCDALPMRTVYLDGTCYFTFVEKFSEVDALRKCQSVFTEATLVTDKSPALDQLTSSFNEFHGSQSTAFLKRALCSYETGAKCDDDETMVANGMCIHVDEERNYYNAVKYCRERKSTLPHISNIEHNQLVAGVLSKEDIKGGWLLQRSNKLSSSFGWIIPYTTHKIEYFSRLEASGGICKSVEALIIQTLAPQCSSFGAWRFGDPSKFNTTVCMRPAASDFTPIDRSIPEPEPTKPTPKPTVDLKPTNDVLTPLKYLYNAWHIKHAFCTCPLCPASGSPCVKFVNNKDVGFSPTWSKAGILGRVITAAGMKKMRELCPKGSAKLVHLFFKQESGRYVADFKWGHTDAGWVALEKGVCGADIPMKEYACRMSRDYMYAQNLEWNTFYKGLVRHNGKPRFWIWK